MTNPHATPAAAPPPLVDALRAYFEATSGAHDPDAATLAALAGGELPEAEAAAAHAGADDSWDTDMAALEAIWGAEAASIDLEAARRARRRRILGAATGLVLAAAAALVLIARPADEGVRFKGGPAAGPPDWSLQVGVKRGDERFVLGSGGTLRTDDQLGFFYSAATVGRLMIAYVDADGTIVRLFPRDRDTARAVPAGRELRLDAGATLTGAQGCEWVVGALGDAPFDLEAVAADVRAARDEADPCTLHLPESAERRYRVVLIRR